MNIVDEMMREDQLAREREALAKEPRQFGQVRGPDGEFYVADSAEDAHFIQIGARHLVPGA